MPYGENARELELMGERRSCGGDKSGSYYRSLAVAWREQMQVSSSARRGGEGGVGRIDTIPLGADPRQILGHRIHRDKGRRG